MTSLGIGLLFGIGVLCIYWSLWPMPERVPSASRTSMRQRLRDELVQAGFESISPVQVVLLSAGAFVLVLLTVLSTTRVLPVALCFAAGAAIVEDRHHSSGTRDSENVRGNSFVSRGICARYELQYIESENPTTDLLNGTVKFHKYMSPFNPAEDIEEIVEFDPNAISTALAG